MCTRTGTASRSTARIAWYEENCEICGYVMRVHRAWDNPPRVNKECRERQAAKWHEKSCHYCGRSIKYHEDWDNVPDYHKECARTTQSCDMCGGSMEVHRGWDNPRRRIRSA